MSRQVVIDASAAGAWLLADERTPESDALLRWANDGTLGLVVPQIWSYEVLNILRSAVARGRVDEREARKVLEPLRAIPKEAVSVETQGEAAILGAAFDHKLSAYDAAYVNLAESRGIDLISGDTDILRLRPRFPWIWTAQDFVKSLLRPA